MIPHDLCPSEKLQYDTLIKVVESRNRRGVKPPQVVMITDIAKDYDDLAALILLKELDRLNVLSLLGLVTNVVPANRRTRFGRGALDLLDLSHIPIASGSSGVGGSTEKRYNVLDYEFDCTFMADEEDPRIYQKSGNDLLHQLCLNAVETGTKLTLLLLSSLEDIHEFARDYPSLLKNAVSDIILQGGYSISSEDVLTPDMNAVNNRYKPDAAVSFHTYMQKSHIPSTVYTKIAAYNTPLTSEFFLHLANTGHPLGEHLRKVQVTQDLAFYNTASSENPEERYAPFMDQAWFLRTRTNWFDKERSREESYPKGEEVIPHLTKVIVYDALAALGCSGQDTLDALGVLKLDSSQLQAVHRVVGSAEPGIYPERMASVLATLMKGSLLTSTCLTSDVSNGYTKAFSA
jgi:inosine-uridine nucleoside N-ribohydrolase